MSIQAVNTLNVFKRNVFKNNGIQECPCGDKKAALLRDIVSQGVFKDTFECCGEKK